MSQTYLILLKNFDRESTRVYKIIKMKKFSFVQKIYKVVVRTNNCYENYFLEC